MATAGEYGAILTLKDNFSGTADKAASKVGAFGKLGSVAGAGLKIAAVGIAAAGTAAAISLKGFSDFESAMLDLKAIATDDLGFGDYEKMYEQAKQLGAATQYSAKEVALGMKELAAAGLKPQQVMDSIAGTLDMAAAGEIEVARAAEIAANTLTQFNLQASETARVADVMAKGASLGTLGMEEMAESLKYVGPIAGGMVNQSLEMVSAALVSLSNNGIKGSQAGTALRGALARLSAPNKNTAAALKELSIQTLDAKGNLKPLTEIVGQFATATQGMGDAQKTAYAKMLVGETAMSGFLALAKDGKVTLEGYTSKLENANGAAEAMAKIKMSGLAGAWELMTGAIDGVVISLGERLAPLLVGITDKVGKLADKANGLFALGDAMRYLGPDTSNISKMFASPARKSDATGTQFVNYAKMSTDKASIASTLSVGNPLPVTKEQIEGVYNAYSKFTELTGLNFDVTQFMTLSQKLNEIKNSFIEYFNAVKVEYAAAFQPVMQALGLEGASNFDLLNAGLSGLKVLFDGITQVVQFLTPVVQTLFQTIVNIAEPIITMVAPAFQSLMSAIQEATPLWSFLGTVLKGVGSILGFIIGAALKFVIDQLTMLISFTSKAIEAFVAFYVPGKTAEQVFNKIGEVIQKVIGYISDLIGKVKSIDFSKIKLPSLGGFFGGQKEFSGASYIMKDEQPALLHRGEAVLTRDENKRFRKMNAEPNVPSLGSNFNVQSNKDDTKGKTVVFNGDIQLNTPLTDVASIEKVVSEFFIRVNTRLNSEGR